MKDSVWRASAWLAVLLAVSGSGCAGLEGPGKRPESGSVVRSSVSEVRPDPACDALARAAALSPTEAEGLLPAAVDAFRTRRSPEARVWVLLLLLRAPPREFGDAWALEMLEAARAWGEGRGDHAALEALLEGIFAARLEQARNLRRAEAGAAEERETGRALRRSLAEARLTLEAERARVQSLQRERDEWEAQVRPLQAGLEEERRRSAELKGQLEQLKAIEKILERREGPVPGEGAQ